MTVFVGVATGEVGDRERIKGNTMLIFEREKKAKTFWTAQDSYREKCCVIKGFG